MDAKSIGALIANLRKKNKMTQSQLAEKLNISDKTVSRWENGLGYPEVMQFPALASIFGVSVDYIMSGDRKGITIAGNILADVVKVVDCYPKAGMLANIKDVITAVGGCVPNTAIDIAKIDSSVPLTALGKVGDDAYGKYVLSVMKENNINCDNVCVSATKPTSFSDVITQIGKERTFFHARGANAEFSIDDIDISSINSVIFHIGYILLLDMFDKEDSEYGTVMARLLHNVQSQGIKTSIDVVSDSTADYKAKIAPALKYCNYAIVNEIESSMLSDLDPYYEDGSLNIDNIKKTMQHMAKLGVKDKVIVHCKKAGFCYDVASGDFNMVTAVNIPREMIKGTVGAGDAFCAGALYGLYNDFSDKEILEFASGAAACNLFAENSIDGMRSKNDIFALIDNFGWEEL